MQRIANHASKMTAGEVTDLTHECVNTILKQVSQILGNGNHPLHPCYILMRSGRRYRSMRARTSRFLNSFVPLSIRKYNEQLQSNWIGLYLVTSLFTYCIVQFLSFFLSFNQMYQYHLQKKTNNTPWYLLLLQIVLYTVWFFKNKIRF